VLLDDDGETVFEWWTWQLLRRKDGVVWRVTSSVGWTKEVDSIWEIGRQMSPLFKRDNTLVVEALFVPVRRRGQRPIAPQTIIPLAEACGELIGGLRMTPRYRPLATLWRYQVLGLPAKTRAKDAERRAIKHASTQFVWPEGAKAPTEAEKGALAEAACIARYGWAQERWDSRRALGGRERATPSRR
jgi:hypothetical protein